MRRRTNLNLKLGIASKPAYMELNTSLYQFEVEHIVLKTKYEVEVLVCTT